MQKEVFFSINKINSIPDNILGVYFLYNKSNEILYIGKSVNVKKRVKQHISSGRIYMRLQIHKIGYIKMHTEFESLMFESQLVKKFRPIYNRRLRKLKNSIYLSYSCSKNSYSQFNFLQNNDNSNSISFTSKHKAKKFLQRIGVEFNLCDVINGIEKSNSCCFNYHLKKCKGACVNLEKIMTYNDRFNSCIKKYFYTGKRNYIISFNDSLKNKSYAVVNDSQVKEFGVSNIKSYSVDYPSKDEIMIINLFKGKYKFRIADV
jgi:DNA polymerase-3 subunit epsilon